MTPSDEATPLTERKRLLETFVRLCQVPSPSGREGQIASLIRKELEGLGLSVEEDGTAGQSRAECGNLLAKVAGPKDARTVLLCAHIDTVPVSGPVEVDSSGGYLTNRNRDVLGADNKAAVAVLIEAARRYCKEQPPVGLELLFTTSEENGLAGAKAFDLNKLESDFGFVFDHASQIGELIVRAPSHQMVAAEFIGRSAHAGICPEEGRSSIVAAAKAIALMELGRLDEGSSANVGKIKGGTAVNVVPDKCSVAAEVRSMDHMNSVSIAQQMIDACNLAAGQEQIDVKVVVQEQFRAYEMSRDDRSVRAAAAAMEDLGIEPIYAKTGGGSDANAFMAAGFECLNVANGTEANHTPDERVSVKALERMLDLCHRIVDRCERV